MKVRNDRDLSLDCAIRHGICVSVHSCQSDESLGHEEG